MGDQPSSNSGRMGDGMAAKVVRLAGGSIGRATSHLVGRARQPDTRTVAAAALSGADSFRRQLNIDLDSSMATFDSVLTRDSNGHQGVSVGDADGDGLDDLYVAQTAGLPNRPYRNRGDSTFEDITDGAGVGVLDDTAQSIFADVDNDGDQDLVVAISTTALFINDGKAHFTPVRDAFRFARPLQGVLTSITMATTTGTGSWISISASTPTSSAPARTRQGRRPRTTTHATDRPACSFEMTAAAVRRCHAGRGARRRRRSLSFRGGLGRLRRRFLAGSLVANDFGTRNLYRNLGRRDGTVRFEDVAASAGVLITAPA